MTISMINSILKTQVLIKESIGAGIKIKDKIFRTKIIICQAIVISKTVLHLSQLSFFIVNSIKLERIKKTPPNAQE